VGFIKSTRSLWEHSAKDGNNIETGDLSVDAAGDVDVQILSQSAGILALSKPADVRTEAVVAAACRRLSQELFLVSRLDSPTSGVLPLAMSPRALHWLQAQFAGRLVEKEYVCLCGGDSLGPPGTKGNIDAPLRALMTRTEVSEHGRAASTDYEVIACFGGP
ncbi:truC, partial [Symbiodinium pilosum]